MARRGCRLTVLVGLAAACAGASAHATAAVTTKAHGATAVAGPSAVGLAGVRFGGDAQVTRVVLDLDGSISARLAPGGETGDRLVFALPPMLSTGALQGRGQGLVQAWSLHDGGSGARLELKTSPGARVARQFLIPPTAEGGAWRYVIDVQAGASGPAHEPPAYPQRIVLASTTPVGSSVAIPRSVGGGVSQTPAQASSYPFVDAPRPPARPAATRTAPPRRPPAPAPASGEESAAAPASPAAPPATSMAAYAEASPRTPTSVRAAVASRGAPQRPGAGKSVKVVVIDPGHGGHDTGARSLVRNEKDINLAAALALRDRLLREGRYKVVMTRDSDVFIPLETRVQIARRAGADLFISLHSDSAGSDPTPHGASVYTLSDHGETRVNNVLGPHEWFGGVGDKRGDPGVRQILLDLTQTSTRNRSSEFAGMLIQHIGDKVDLLPRSHRDAGYFVLLAPDVPAVLLEMGFITNPADEMRLTDPAQRTALVNGVADAIDAYFFGAPRLTAG